MEWKVSEIIDLDQGKRSLQRHPIAIHKIRGLALANPLSSLLSRVN